jgi:hypothetical protein
LLRLALWRSKLPYKRAGLAGKRLPSSISRS